MKFQAALKIVQIPSKRVYKSFWTAAIAMVCIGVGGCSNLYEPSPITTPVKDETIISRTASLSNVYILDKETSFVTCSEPPPDASFSQSDAADFSFSLFHTGGSDKEHEGEESEEASLVGRSPGVLIARELFFRACEFSRNYELNKAEAISLYKETLLAVEKGWKSEGTNTTVKIDESETQTINQRISSSTGHAGSNIPNAAPTTIRHPDGGITTLHHTQHGVFSTHTSPKGEIKHQFHRAPTPVSPSSIPPPPPIPSG